MKSNYLRIIAILVVAITAVIYLALRATNEIVSPDDEIGQSDTTLTTPEPAKLFGLIVDSFNIIDGQIKSGDSFGKLTGEAGLSAAQIANIAQRIDSIFDVRKIAIGKKYTILKGSHAHKPSYFIYEASKRTYYLVGLGDSVFCKVVQRKQTIKERVVTGVITHSLYETLAKQEVHPGLAMKLADIYAWTIDFFHIQKGDSITVLFQEVYVDDTLYVGPGNILAARFDHFKEPFFAFRYTDTTGQTDYYDFEGNSLRKAFLKAPLNYSRISSRYSARRYHPVLTVWKAHLGTDYAAPRGTPIMTTADGIIDKAGYTKGNGNYVKVRHNSTYSTQYLHMSKIAKGIKAGVAVKQGEVIGYVGSTGLATGPHVCYRFWVNGKQVDPYKQKLPDANPIDTAYKADFLKRASLLKKRISKL